MRFFKIKYHWCFRVCEHNPPFLSGIKLKFILLGVAKNAITGSPFWYIDTSSDFALNKKI